MITFYIVLKEHCNKGYTKCIYKNTLSTEMKSNVLVQSEGMLVIRPVFPSCWYATDIMMTSNLFLNKWPMKQFDSHVQYTGTMPPLWFPLGSFVECFTVLKAYCSMTMRFSAMHHYVRGMDSLMVKLRV